LRGLLDGAILARELLGGKGDLPAEYARQVDEIANNRSEQLSNWSGLYLPVASQKSSQGGNATNLEEVSRACLAKRGEKVGEQMGEQCLGGGNRGDLLVSINMPGGKDRATDELSAQEGEDRGEQDKKDREARSEQQVDSSQWLKSLLPEASSGWWDLRDKGN